jgi:hypothetical protein
MMSIVIIILVFSLVILTLPAPLFIATLMAFH